MNTSHEQSVPSSATESKSAEKQPLSPPRPDLIFGVVGAVGSDLNGVINKLEAELKRVGYLSKRIKLSEILRRLPGNENLSKLVQGPKFDYYAEHMRAGTKLCERHKRGDALSILSIPEIVRARDELNKLRASISGVEEGYAFIIDSIKRPQEVDFYRRLYGDFFTLIGVFGSREARVQDLAKRISASPNAEKDRSSRAQAEDLIAIDELETGTKYGQNVGDTFWRSDFFIRGDRQAHIQDEIQRFIRILFDAPDVSPKRDEMFMYLAKAMSMRSADLSRQVGAVIVSPEYEPIASGCNEVPKAGGGQYWGDSSAVRDIELGHDSNATIKKELVQELFGRLKSNGWLSSTIGDLPIEVLVEQAIGGDNSPLKGTRADNLIEFGRMVHAEMAAITQLSRLGISGVNSTLYCTTFPCHMCARHIVVSGVRRVVYIEPYPKSLAADLYPDSIAVNPDIETKKRVNFVPFEGVAPRRFLQFFEKSRRKDGKGIAKNWNEGAAFPLVASKMIVSTSRVAEDLVLNEIPTWLPNASETAK